MSCTETMKVAKKAEISLCIQAMLRRKTGLSKHLVCIDHLEMTALKLK